MNCNQHGCNDEAEYLFTWPGEDQKGICKRHSYKLRGIAEAIGLHLQLIPILKDEQTS